MFRILPGDPARLLLPRGALEAGAVEQQREVLHLDRPLPQQFAYFWIDTVRLRFGQSFVDKRPVTEVVGERVVPTLLLVGVGELIAVLVGTLLGGLAGWRRGTKADVAITKLGIILYSMPMFWVGLLCIMVFSVWLGWFPSGGMREAGVTASDSLTGLSSLLHHLALPAVVFAVAYAGQYELIMRSSVIGVKNEDFVLTARGKGLSGLRVLRKHVVPNAWLPLATITMMHLGFVMSGAVLVETVFNWPGLGLLSYESLSSRDYPVLQGVFLLTAVAIVVTNLIADIMYYYLDPRVSS